MVRDDIFKIVEDELCDKGDVDPFRKFGFKCDLRNEVPSELSTLMVWHHLKIKSC